MAGLSFPVVCPKLVGRENELAELVSSVLSESRSSIRAHLIFGEAGIGKSRLVFAIAERVQSQAVLPLRFSCREGDANQPYAGIKELLRSLLRHDESFLDAHLRPFAAELVPLLPALSTLLQDDGSPAPDSDQQRTPDALQGVLSSISAEQPCLLVAEDLHWCDSSTLAALLHLARPTLEPSPTLLLTLRPNEGSDDVRAFLADLERERLASELYLTPLTLADTDEMIKAVFDSSRATPIELLHGLFSLSEGNPFFVEEILRSLLAESSSRDLRSLRLNRARVPRTVQETVRHRADMLSSQAKRLLEIASVIGSDFDTETVSVLSGLDSTSVLRCLRELTGSQLVFEQESGDFTFSHALTREAILSRLLARESAVLHEQVGRYLECKGPIDDHVEELAYHYFEAGIWEKARDYALIAGQLALDLYAPAIALKHFNRALQASAHMREAAAASLHRGLAAAFEALGDFDKAREQLETAISRAESTGENVVLVDSMLDLGLLWSSRDYSQALTYYEHAVEVARALDEPRVLARSLGRLANGHSNVGALDDSLQLLDEALTIWRGLNEPRGVAETLDLIGMTGLMGGRLSESLEAYQEAIGLMETFEEKRNTISVLASIPVLSGTYQTVMLRPALSLLEARPFAEEALQRARELGVPSDLSYVLWQNGFWLGPQGRMVEAFALTNESLALAVEHEHRQWEAAAHAVLGALYADIFELESAQSHLQEALTISGEIGSSLWDAQMKSLLTDVLVQLRRTDEAAQLFEGMTLETMRPPRSMLDVWQMSAQAEIGFAKEDYPAVERIIATIGESRKIGLKLHRLQALMAARQDSPAAAAVILQGLASTAKQQGNRSMFWRLQCDLAHVHLNCDQREGAREAAVAALAAIDEVATNVENGDAFRASAAIMLPASLRARPSRSSSGPLTARESEIAALIARGLTSREIAEALVLSSRTVETHVGNAMSKLGFSTRSQLAAWSIEHHVDT